MVKSEALSTPREGQRAVSGRGMTTAVGSMVPTSGALSLSDDSRDGSITADPPPSGRAQTSDLKVLLSVLRHARAGDVAARAPLDWTGLPGQVARCLNDVIAANQALAEETSGVIDAVRAGDLSKRSSTPGAVSELGERINAMASELDQIVSELTRVARTVGTTANVDQAPVISIKARGDWNTLIENFNVMAKNLTVRTRDLQTSSEQLRVLANVAPIGIFQLDRDNRILYVNSHWSEMTGISSEAAIGRTWNDLAETQRGGAVSEIIELVDDQPSSAHRFEIHLPGEPARILLATSVRASDAEGRFEGGVGIVADVTAETEAKVAMATARDAADEASRLKSDFLANMSHEIRTPMNGVIGLTELLLETDLDARQRDYALAVRRSGEALLEIINGILDFSKVEAGKLEIVHDRFGLRVVVDDVVDLLAGSAQRKGLELVVVYERSIPEVVIGDPGRLRQVLINLVGNALKFTHQGEVVLRVAASGSGDDSAIRFTISDTGDGIGPDKIESIFQPFVQADTSTTRKYDGTGLGLAISAQLVHLMEGEYGVSSTLGMGSTFWFSIPYTPGAVEDTQAPPTSYPELEGVSIIVVDDNPTQLGVLSKDLTDFGMSVTALDSASAALSTIRKAAKEGKPFAVALFDWSMPDMGGLALSNAIAIDKALHTPVILMTGLHRDRSLRSTVPGVSATLSKPVHRKELVTCVRVALGVHVDDLEATVGSAPFPAPERTLASGRILVAEDNLINQKVAVAMLSGAGYRVDTVPDGISAVQAVATQRYDAIIMDCQLPGLSGYEATAEIRAREGTGRHTPIIAMTAGARREDRERCLAQGMDSYLSKPVSRETLLDLVEHSIKAARATPSGGVPEGGHWSSGNEVILDPGVFDRLRFLEKTSGRGFLNNLISEFISSTDLQLRDLSSALDDADGPTVGRIAHTIGEGSARLGGRRLALTCNQLERKTLTDSLSEGQSDLDRVEADYDDLRFALMQELATSGRKARVG